MTSTCGRYNDQCACVVLEVARQQGKKRHEKMKQDQTQTATHCHPSRGAAQVPGNLLGSGSRTIR